MRLIGSGGVAAAVAVVDGGARRGERLKRSLLCHISRFCSWNDDGMRRCIFIIVSK